MDHGLAFVQLRDWYRLHIIPGIFIEHFYELVTPYWLLKSSSGNWVVRQPQKHRSVQDPLARTHAPPARHRSQIECLGLHCAAGVSGGHAVVGEGWVRESSLGWRALVDTGACGRGQAE